MGLLERVAPGAQLLPTSGHEACERLHDDAHMRSQKHQVAREAAQSESDALCSARGRAAPIDQLEASVDRLYREAEERKRRWQRKEEAGQRPLAPSCRAMTKNALAQITDRLFREYHAREVRRQHARESRLLEEEKMVRTRGPRTGGDPQRFKQLFADSERRRRAQCDHEKKAKDAEEQFLTLVSIHTNLLGDDAAFDRLFQDALDREKKRTMLAKKRADLKDAEIDAMKVRRPPAACQAIAQRLHKDAEERSARHEATRQMLRQEEFDNILTKIGPKKGRKLVANRCESLFQDALRRQEDFKARQQDMGDRITQPRRLAVEAPQKAVAAVASFWSRRMSLSSESSDDAETAAIDAIACQVLQASTKQEWCRRVNKSESDLDAKRHRKVPTWTQMQQDGEAVTKSGYPKTRVRQSRTSPGDVPRGSVDNADGRKRSSSARSRRSREDIVPIPELRKLYFSDLRQFRCQPEKRAKKRVSEDLRTVAAQVDAEEKRRQSAALRIQAFVRGRMTFRAVSQLQADRLKAQEPARKRSAARSGGQTAETGEVEGLEPFQYVAALEALERQVAVEREARFAMEAEFVDREIVDRVEERLFNLEQWITADFVALRHAFDKESAVQTVRMLEALGRSVAGEREARLEAQAETADREIVDHIEERLANLEQKLKLESTTAKEVPQAVF